MSQFNVDSAQVASAASQAHVTGESIRAEVSAMMGHLTALEGTWQGNASAAYAVVLDQWRGAQAQVETALESLSTALNQAAQTYATAEDTASRLFSAR
ncbi:WXG100 family type VII secretion target [Demequina sp. B12]|uniref:WXG100 family type VII secretion target n=1 Tax=Demequina sp. B12 TaxID=2992757 RepID=UPI00237C234E|nr:WXG100 family type VII secretion target [Demequina sp. B12]MDE0573718.1 WXG100 family type VII secretion target [Demequina sp. B12]